jgi:homocysteine S-methyltransferase
LNGKEKKKRATTSLKKIMLSTKDLSSLLANGKSLIIDGALATELETRGHDLSHALWSGKTLLEDPDCIRQVHLDYFLAGADIAITASYQASIIGLQQHLSLSETEAKDLVKLSATLAQEARQQAYDSGVPSTRKLLVAGSVGPYGAYLADGSEYRGDYTCSPEEFNDFHRPRIAALLDAGVDLLGIETIPSFNEVRALLDLLRSEFPSATAWLGCTLKDASHLSDGTPLSEVLSLVSQYSEQVLSFGINCVPPQTALESLQHMRSLTDLPLLCYPNSGETYVPKEHVWTGDKSGQAIRESAVQFRSAGASLIGGCCRTTPEDIKNIALVLNGA